MTDECDLKARVQSFFDDFPLPFKYFSFPYLDDTPRPRHPYMYFFVNLSINELVWRFFNKAGLPHTKEGKWNISWGQQYDPPEYRACKAWQKINHFAGAFLMGKKGELHMRLTSMKERNPDKLDFYPESYLMPSDKNALTDVWSTRKLWIAKVSASSKGEGITIYRGSDPMPTDLKDCVVQAYIERPLLIHNKKFDVRLYALVTSIAPLRVYLHEYGLVRLATNDYSVDNPTDDLTSHVTNVSVNRQEAGFVAENQKVPLSVLYETVKDRIDPVEMRRKFEEIVAKTVVSCASKIRQHHQSLMLHRNTSIELYGVDILVDSDLKCWLMEVNISPSMAGTDVEFDSNQKREILAEMYNMARVVDCDPNAEKPCPQIEIYDEQWRKSLIGMRGKETPWDWRSPEFADMVIVRDFLEEKKMVRKFRRIFPKRKTLDLFLPCYEKMGYCDMSFIEWIRMDSKHRLEALERGRCAYAGTFGTIF